MTIRIIPPHSVDAETEHYAAVTEHMIQHGAPTIRAWWDECERAWVAVEGSHRIAIALDLGITPEIDDVGESVEARAQALRDADIDLSSRAGAEDEELVWWWGDRAGRRVVTFAD